MTPSGIAIHAQQQSGTPASTNKTPSVIAIATPDSGDGSKDGSHSGTMPYTCQSCSRRKVKCDKTIPECLRCSKGKTECIYQAPPPRQSRKRKHVEEVYERLARYEKILKENSLLPDADMHSNSPTGTKDRVEEEEGNENTGRFLSGNGKSRYLNGSLWFDVGEINISEDEDEIYSDPISGALLGISQDLLHCHPSHEGAMKLWEAHVQNVEPLIKVLHIPTTRKMVEMVSQKPAMASKTQECLLFAIYHFATFSMTEEECGSVFGQSRTELLEIYQPALRQALVNASWLKTTKIPVIQAYVLFLISIRTESDPHTFWMLTGIGTRIAQRMGLNRDGETLGLPPFDVELRRRLFWQLLPLDGYAGQVSGTGISMLPDSWDTKQPLNINDEQIWPGMTQKPEEQKGATEMIFCLTRTELSQFYNKTGLKTKNTGSTIQLSKGPEFERLIDEVESVIEAKCLRYCDIVIPLHFLTLGIARSVANTARLRSQMPPLINQTIRDVDRRKLCVIAQQILDTNNAAYSNPSLKIFRWQFKAFFLWDALMCILTSLAKVGFFSPSDLDKAWKTLEMVYMNHPDIILGKEPLLVAIVKATLQAWGVNPLRDSIPEPGFITEIKANRNIQTKNYGSSSGSGGAANAYTGPDLDEPLATTDIDFHSTFTLNVNKDGFDLGNDFDISTADWMLWDQLCPSEAD